MLKLIRLQQCFFKLNYIANRMHNYAIGVAVGIVVPTVIHLIMLLYLRQGATSAAVRSGVSAKSASSEASPAPPQVLLMDKNANISILELDTIASSILHSGTLLDEAWTRGELKQVETLKDVWRA